MSKKYRITVDGTSYTVEVEELGSVASTPVPAATTVAPAPTPAAAAAPAPAVPAPAPAPAAAPAPVSGGAVVEAPMPGKILKVAVSAGSPVKSGEIVIVLEAMKMENEIFSPSDGVVKEIRCREGDAVNTGDIMMVIA